MHIHMFCRWPLTDHQFPLVCRKGNSKVAHKIKCLLVINYHFFYLNTQGFRLFLLSQCPPAPVPPLGYITCPPLQVPPAPAQLHLVCAGMSDDGTYLLLMIIMIF